VPRRISFKIRTKEEVHHGWIKEIGMKTRNAEENSKKRSENIKNREHSERKWLAANSTSKYTKREKNKWKINMQRIFFWEGIKTEFLSRSWWWA